MALKKQHPLKGRKQTKEHITKRSHTFFKEGKLHPFFKGGYVDQKGYRIRSIMGTRIKEHQLVWIRHNKMPIPKGFIIHHLNGIRSDNRIENLQLFPSKLHQKLHAIVNHPKGSQFGDKIIGGIKW